MGGGDVMRLRALPAGVSVPGGTCEYQVREGESREHGGRDRHERCHLDLHGGGKSQNGAKQEGDIRIWRVERLPDQSVQRGGQGARTAAGRPVRGMAPSSRRRVTTHRGELG